MSSAKKMLIGAVVALASLLSINAVAAAAIVPDPYSTTAGSGAFSTRSILGRAGCALSSMVIDGTSGTGDVRGEATVTGFNATGCSGVIASARYNKSITVLLKSNGVALVPNVALLVANILGGNCLYLGYMRGTWRQSGPDIVVNVAGAIPLYRTLSGICTADADANLDVTAPGLVVT